MMATFLHRLGLGAYRHRKVVAAVWLLLLVAAGVGATTLSGTTVNTFSIPGQESTTALDLIGERFGSGANGAGAQVVFEAPAGSTVRSGSTAATIADTVAKLQKLDGVVSATNPLDPKAPAVSPDNLAAYSTVTYGVQAPDITYTQRAALLGVVQNARDAGLTTEVTGEASQPTSGVGGAAELIGVLAALVVLALTYGSLVAAGMNLLTAIVGVGIGAAGITTLTGFVDLQSTTPILALMLGLAVGIDYALFIFTRFRQELQRGRDVGDAVATAVGTAGSAVLTAGITVVIALAGLAVAGIPFLTEMGLAAAATVVVSVLLALTLVPAVLGFVGRRMLPRKARRDRGFWTGWAGTVTSRPGFSLVAAVVALAVIAIPVFSMRTTLVPAEVPGTTQAKAADILTERFGPGVTGPLVVLVDGPGATGRAATVSKEVATLPDVAAATPPRPSPDGAAALVTVVPASAPDSEETVALVHELRDRFGGDNTPRVYVTGNTAVSVDVSQQLDHALPIYLVLVVGLALVLLILVFRSILVPVVGVLGFLLTIGSALGATVAVFQWGWLKGLVQADTAGPLLSLTPILVIGVLFGLAMDYQVFLVSRIHEAHAHGAEPIPAIRTGFRQAAPVVVAAAAIMFSVFAGFVIPGDATIKPIASALALGILFDAVVVRMIIMPSALALLGARAWWLPRWLNWLPKLDVEGLALERPAPERTKEPVAG
jgi:RND superfamily putative drug exporter